MAAKKGLVWQTRQGSCGGKDEAPVAAKTGFLWRLRQGSCGWQDKGPVAVLAKTRVPMVDRTGFNWCDKTRNSSAKTGTTSDPEFSSIWWYPDPNVCKMLDPYPHKTQVDPNP